ncbi:MAG: aminopeptidase P N-terminal domain-containing protein [Deltaproteobacteria bacterium]|nr:aminopeptidase P N-terminal domain-containing protein [Deltaproteobacteria bacterium]
MSHDNALFARRREALAAEMVRRGGGTLLLPAADEKIRSNDSEYIFRQDSDFHYVTGLDEPQGCALLVARPGEPVRFVLFVRPRDKEKEIWNGFRTGVEGAKAVYGADEAFPVAEMDQRLPGLVDGCGTLYFRLAHDAEWDARLARTLRDLRARARAGARAPAVVVDAAALVHEQRLVKSPEELALLRRAAEITAEAHLAAMRDGLHGRREYQVQAEIEYAFRRRGGDGPGYGTIVASGANSCILHYRAGEAELRDGDVCLVDAGGEYRSYTADVTRTFPVSGSFSKEQRALYEVVLDAQKSCIEAVRPGATIDGLHDITVRRLTEGMIALGLLSGGVADRIADLSFRKYYMHRTSHWLGLDVHDVGDYYPEKKSRALVPGMVITVEPGLYVAADDATAPEGLRGVGVRIEDDLLVTAEGNEVLTAAVPKEVREVEAACTR